MLALVFVDALHLDVKNRGRIHQHAGVAMDVLGEVAFHRQLGGTPALQEAAVADVLFQLPQLIEITHPAFADGFVQQARELGIGQGHPASWRDAIGDIGELFGPEAGEFREQILLHQSAVQRRHAVDVVGRHRGQVRHAHRLGALVVDDRQFAQNLIVAGILEPHLLQETAVDFVDQLQVPRQQRAEQVQAPLLQGLRQQGVIGVGERAAGDVPGFGPIEMFVVEQQPHQFRHGNRRVGVVQLYSPMIRELADRDAAHVEAADHVLQRAAHKEVLLLQPQLAALIGAIVGIEHLGEGFRTHLLLNGAVVIAAVEGKEIKAFGGISPPKAQAIAGVDPIAQHRHIVGHTDGVFGRNPAHPVGAPFIAVALSAATKADETGLVWVGNLPGPARLQPLVGDLHLPAVADQLVEDAELVADAVARGRDLQGGQGFEEAGRQTPKAAIAESGFLLHIEDFFDVVDAETTQSLGHLIADAEHQQVVAQLGADQKLGRQISHGPGGGRADRLDTCQVAGHQPVPHRIAQRHVEVVAAGGGRELAKRIEEMLRHPIEEAFSRQAAAVRVGVAAWGGQAEVDGMVLGHLVGGLQTRSTGQDRSHGCG